MQIEIKDHIFREYDIRGKFGTDITQDTAELLAKAFCYYLGQKTGKTNFKVSIGMDARLSSETLRNGLALGLMSGGASVVDIGLCPTPLQYFSLFADELDGGIMITGSHNPSEYNGFKISVCQETIYGDEIQEIKKIMKAFSDRGSTIVARIRGNLQNVDLIPHYTDTILKNFEGTLPASDLKKPIKVVIDAGNGTGGLVAPELLRQLGCEVVELFCKPDGKFPNHHPDPTVEANLTALKAEVAEQGADFGVGYDGDSDRIGVIDEKGSVVWGDQLMVIFARAILAKSPGETIVGEVKCSQTMYDEIKKSGGKAVMWKTGHSLIKSRMKELNAAMAGEMSGHIFFADRYFGFDDAIYATCRLVEILAAKRAENPDYAFSSLLDGLAKTITTPEIRVECPEQEKFEIIESLKKVIKEGVPGPQIKELIDIDGVRVVFEDGWGLVRASNTQPVLVMRFEATSETLLEDYKGFMRAALGRAWPSGTIQV